MTHEAAANKICAWIVDEKEHLGLQGKIVDLIRQSNAAAEKAATDWRPIESAPKTGEQFLVTNGDIVIPADIVDGHNELSLYNCTMFFDHQLKPMTHWMPSPNRRR